MRVKDHVKLISFHWKHFEVWCGSAMTARAQIFKNPGIICRRCWNYNYQTVNHNYYLAPFHECFTSASCARYARGISPTILKFINLFFRVSFSRADAWTHLLTSGIDSNFSHVIIDIYLYHRFFFFPPLIIIVNWKNIVFI